MRAIPAYSGNDPAIKALIENVETLAGHRGKPGADSRAPTYAELVSAGLITLDSKGKPIAAATSTASAADDKLQKWLETKGAGSSGATARGYTFTANFSLKASQSGAVIQNTGATSPIRGDLPAATPGLTFLFCRRDGTSQPSPSYTLKIYPHQGEFIWNPGSRLAKTVNVGISLAYGAMIRLTCFENGVWDAEHQTGTITYLS